MIADDELQTIANLAHINLDESDVERLRLGVSQMVEYFSSMADVDVEGIPAMTHVHTDRSRLREDRVFQTVEADDVLEKADDLEDRYIAVPNVL